MKTKEEEEEEEKKQILVTLIGEATVLYKLLTDVREVLEEINNR